MTPLYQMWRDQYIGELRAAAERHEAEIRRKEWNAETLYLAGMGPRPPHLGPEPPSLWSRFRAWHTPTPGRTGGGR